MILENDDALWPKNRLQLEGKFNKAISSDTDLRYKDMVKSSQEVSKG